MILISTYVHEFLLSKFSEKNIPVEYHPDIQNEALIPLLKDATGLVITTRIRIDQRLLDAAPKLQWIGRLGSGLELIDLTALKKRGIEFISTPEGNCQSVGEQNLGTLLSLMHKINSSAAEVKNYTWLRNENRGIELQGKTVGIYGLGHTGTAFARLLQPFGGLVLAYDKYKSGFANDYIREADPAQIAKHADVISFHLPLTPETRHIANEDFFFRLEKKPILLNTSRGAIMDTSALIDALKKGQISGAGLDVLENEKLNSFLSAERQAFEFLTQHPAVIVTPHIAGYSHEAFYRMSFILIQKLEALQLL